MLLFLDFDGVLHPKGAGQTHFTRLPLLESFLREPEFSQVQLVISSTWRHAYSMPKLRSFFSPDIGPRIIGGTPHLDEYASDYERGEEIAAWLEDKPDSSWVILDDDAEGFAPRIHDRVVLCDGSTGLSLKDLERVRQMLLVDSP